MTADTIERALRLNVKVRQAPSGVTEQSKALFDMQRDRIGPVDRIVLVYVTDPTWDFFTYVVDGSGAALRFDGFGWGYAGEGARGLAWLLDQLNFTHHDVTRLPRAHEPGCWTLRRSGHLVKEDVA